MIEKIPATPRINKLRVINIYEADYNLLLKHFLPNKATKYAVQTEIIGNNQWEYIPGGSAGLVTMIEKFILETYCITFKDLVTLQNDAKTYFDQIINSHSTLYSCRFDIPDNIYKLHSTTLRNLICRVQTALGTIQYHYRYSSNSPTHGSG